MLVGAEAWTQVFRLRTVSAAPGCLWVVPDLDVLEREFEESEVSTMRMGCKDQSCVFSSQYTGNRITETRNQVVTPTFKKSVIIYSCAARQLRGSVRQDFPGLDTSLHVPVG